MTSSPIPTISNNRVVSRVYVRFGSLADLFTDITPMSGIGAKAGIESSSEIELPRNSVPVIQPDKLLAKPIVVWWH